MPRGFLRSPVGVMRVQWRCPLLGARTPHSAMGLIGSQSLRNVPATYWWLLVDVISLSPASCNQTPTTGINPNASLPSVSAVSLHLWVRSQSHASIRDLRNTYILLCSMHQQRI